MKIQTMRVIPAGNVLAVAVALAVASGIAANAEVVYGVSDQLDELVSFDSASPGTLLSAHSITGLQSGEEVRGIDWIGGTLYGLGNQSHFYTINPYRRCHAGRHCVQPGFERHRLWLQCRIKPALCVQRLWTNLTINPITGAATAGPNYTGAGIDAMAYDYSNGGFYGISADTHDLYDMNPATGGTSLIGPTGVDFADRIGFDISPVTDNAFFSGTVDGQTGFYSVDLVTGALDFIGDIGTPGELTSGLDSIAIVPEPATAAMFAMGGGFMLALFHRKK